MDFKKLFDLTSEDNLILNDDFDKCNINKTKTIILKGNIVTKKL